MQGIVRAIELLEEGHKAFKEFCRKYNIKYVFIGSSCGVEAGAWKQFMRKAIPRNREVLTLLKKELPMTHEIAVLEEYVEEYEELIEAWDLVGTSVLRTGRNFPSRLEYKLVRMADTF